MAGRRIAYGLLLLVSAAFWIYYDGRVSAYLFGVVLALPFFSLLVSLPFAGGLAAEISHPPVLQRGSDCSLFFRIRSRNRPAVLPGRIRAVFRDLMEDRCDRMSFDAPEDGSIVFRAAHSGVWQAEIQSAFAAAEAAVAPDPMPNLEQILNQQLRPKNGGYSEIHELREYRPGDPLRTVHWKATAKTDSPVVREPQEALSRRALLTCALSPDRDEADRALDTLAWVSESLIGLDIPHGILTANDGRLFRIAVRDDLTALLLTLMSSPLPREAAESPSSLPEADWVFRIGNEPGQDSGKEGKS